jgi:hypothetical protein
LEGVFDGSIDKNWVVDLHAAVFVGWIVLFVTATTFEDLKNTGNLRLIHDTELRSKINNYYVISESNHWRIMARTTGYFMFVHAILPAELR